jgi:hypothetical protein
VRFTLTNPFDAAASRRLIRSSAFALISCSVQLLSSSVRIVLRSFAAPHRDGRVDVFVHQIVRGLVAIRHRHPLKYVLVLF